MFKVGDIARIIKNKKFVRITKIKDGALTYEGGVGVKGTVSTAFAGATLQFIGRDPDLSRIDGGDFYFDDEK